MEEHTKALADLTAAIGALTAKIDDIHPVILDLQGWRPSIEQSVADLRAEMGTLRVQIGDKAKSSDEARAAPPPLRLADVPPLLPLAVNATHASTGDPVLVRGDATHGPAGHGVSSDPRGRSPPHDCLRPLVRLSSIIPVSKRSRGTRGTIDCHHRHGLIFRCLMEPIRVPGV